ncbi:hypothetical protein AALP_AA7G249900 [Arabis alpina]|uniref:glutamate--tRNA ligase n=1 Tax=Arabis alpina TaxID=50452 RepID=A0A087GKE7_ARAAL|nr:hypothetical protein AALP_AA7G249900 [Arabis alpina]
MQQTVAASIQQAMTGLINEDNPFVDEWLDYASVFSSGSEFGNACNLIDKYLESRTFLVGHSISIADVSLWSALAVTGQRWDSLRKSKKYPSLVRWFNSILDEYSEVLATYVVKTDAEDKGKPLIDLPGADFGKVRFRFAPEPSGYLHIGHAKAALLNKYFVDRYKGELILRFDDTNPARENNEFVDSLIKDVGTLGIKYKKVTYTSDYFPDLMKMAEKLMREGKAYVDDTPTEQMKEERKNGITHALRSSEYHDRNAQYSRVQDDMGMQRVQIYEFSRLNLVYTLLSKRKLLWFVNEGLVDGWDDPRFPTVQGIVRRGLKIEALIQFILEQGASKNLNLMEWDKIWSINKKIIDPVCPRHTAVIENRRVLLTLTNGPDEPFVRIIPKHKKFEGAGEKATTFTKRIWIEGGDASAISIDEEVTLMDWGNAIVKEIVKDSQGHVTALSGVLNLQGSVKTTKLKLTWLPDTNELVNLTLIDFDYLITKKKLKEDEKVRAVVNPHTKKETLALGDSNMRNLKREDVIQLERKGYFRSVVAVDLISSVRVQLKLDSVYTEYSAQYLVENACPKKRQGTDLKLTVKDCLEFALKEGIPKAEDWPHLGSEVKPPSSYKPALVSMKGEVIEAENMEEAWDLSRYQPVAAKLHLFSPHIDLVGDGIYGGPSGEEAGYVGLRDVIIVDEQMIQGKAIARFQFVKVAMGMMFVLAFPDDDDSRNVKLTFLLVDFVVPRLSSN